MPVDLELDDDALEWFTGEPFYAGYGKTHYECTRCELNAFSSDGLAEFIEAGLQRHGAATKLVPPANVLAAHALIVRDLAIRDSVIKELDQLVDIDEVVRQLVASHPGLADVNEADVRDGFISNPTQSWRSSSEQLVRKNINATDGITDAVHAQLLEQLSASINDDNGETGEQP